VAKRIEKKGEKNLLSFHGPAAEKGNKRKTGHSDGRWSGVGRCSKKKKGKKEKVAEMPFPHREKEGEKGRKKGSHPSARS